jgi:hypothetical protein
MKRLKKILRLAGLVLLISLALCGIGIIGGVPVPPPRKKEDAIELRIELKEDKKKETDAEIFKFKE